MMTSGEVGAVFSFFAFGLTIGLAFGGCCGESRGINSERKLAIKASVAEWRVDPQTGETQFVYKGDVE